MRAICLGSAACMAEDLAAAAALGIVPGEGWLMIAVNQAAKDWPGQLDHWVSMHLNLVPRWAAEREAAGRSPAGWYWSAERRDLPPSLADKTSLVKNYGGSSGMLATTVALHLGAERVVLCGIPIDYKQGHMGDPRPWRDAAHYFGHWVDRAREFGGRVKSMSGNTKKWLGEPTLEWLADSEHAPAP
jgi:hypothetical protein